VTEFSHQFANNPDVEVYDYGVSSRFGQGYVILSWKGDVPVEFERQLNEDDRLEGHSLYHQVEMPLYVAKGKGV
jgi:hypothetical protein